MSFLNQALLVGVLTMAIPVLLHLVRRQRFTVVRWGAMHLLEGAVSSRRRTVRLEQIVLVVIRMALLGLLAAAMARPEFRMAGGAGATGGNRAVAIVLDVSSSLEYGDADAARDAALGILRTFGERDTVSLVLAAERPRVLLEGTVGPGEEFAKAVQGVSWVHGTPDFAAALLMAGKRLADLDVSERELVVITDTQAANWSLTRSAAVEASLGTLRGEGSPVITWVLVGADTPARTDLPFIAAVDVPLQPVGVEERIEIRVRVRPRGQSPRGCRISMYIDGIWMDDSQVELDGERSREVVFHHAFFEVGSHWLEARIEGQDHSDGRYLAAVVVREDVSVLVVDGDPHADSLRGETGFLRLALGSRDDTDGGHDGFHVVLAAAAKLDALSLDAVDVVILANVDSPPVSLVADIEGFVREGGGLLVFTGDRIDAQFYNRALHSDGEGVLPASLGGLATAREGDGGAGIELAVVGHPALGSLSSRDFQQARITRWFELETGASPDITLLLRLDGGAPFLVEKRLEWGRAILCATAGDDGWSNLPLRPFYLPLVQQLVVHLAVGDLPARTLCPAERLTLEQPASRVGDAVVLRLPGGNEVEGISVLREGSAVFEYRDTMTPGLHVAFPAGGKPQHFAVNTDRGESDLRRLAPGDLRRTIEGLGIECAVGEKAAVALMSERQHGVEIWKPLLATVLALAFLELVVVQRIERTPMVR